MIKRILTVSAAALMVTLGAQGASATSVAPESYTKAPAATSDGSYKTAWHKGKAHRRNRVRRNRNRRNRRRRNRNIGIGIGLGALALGAAAAAAAEDDRRSYRSCRRVERRCARRHGWETRRWYWCVEDRGC